ncbi:MAG: FecR family protein [Lachnospiraceae bacterium]|nr:FecR family protein [Lachnospiraceae bacterium]
MKTFLTTAKGKIIAGVGTAAVVAAGVIAAIVLNSGYRTIVVNELNGTTNIVNETKESEAFLGQHLVSGDDVTVRPASDLTLALDEDKYVFAEENTHFLIEAKGKLNDTRTDIYMDEGSNLFRIDQKLKDEEEFKVDTPNSTMSVRGTVFRVSLRRDSNGDKYTLVEVFEGEVFVEAKLELGDVTGESTVLHAGESVIIRSNTGFSEFVKGEDGKSVKEIEYDKIPKKTAMKLGLAIDEGRNLSITKELLYDVVSITEHVFEKKEVVVEATCNMAGKYYEICSVCGLKSEEIEIPKIDHDYYEEEYIPDDCSEEGYVIKKCRLCDEEIKTVTEGTGHVYDDKWTIVNPSTCTVEGLRERVCLNCGKPQKEVVKLAEHNYGLPHTIMEATYDNYGLIGRTCSVCSVVKVDEAVIVDKLTPPPAPVEAPRSESRSESHHHDDDDDDDDTPSTPAHTHSWITNNSPGSVYRAASCTNAGIKDEVCTGCGATRSVNLPIDPTAHTWNSWAPNPASTDLSRSCSLGCGTTETHYTAIGTTAEDSDGDGWCDICSGSVDSNGIHS